MESQMRNVCIMYWLCFEMLHIGCLPVKRELFTGNTKLNLKYKSNVSIVTTANGSCHEATIMLHL
jgi:hypothetical protein